MVKRGSVAVVLAALATGCDDDIEQPKVAQLKHDEAVVTGDAGHTIPPAECGNATCCPKATETPECYYQGSNPSEYSGAECMAQRDNTAKPHWQLRQTQSISTAPPGNTDSLVAAILLARSTLHSQACAGGDGAGGFIQLVDLDREKGIALTGFAAFVREQSDALAQGLCFVEDTYDDPPRRIPELYAPPPGWPKGLPAPQPLPWKVAPVKGYRYTEDFVVKTDREKILARLADDPELTAGGYTGIYYFDETRGYMHGYAPLGYVVTYDDAATYNAVPIREAEITSQMNDPAHPNCSGVYGANELPQTCANSTASPAWSCAAGNCAPGVLGPTKVEGYFLTVEAEQVYLNVLKQTLCYRSPLPGEYDGWTFEPNADTAYLCRNSPKWDPMDPVKGLPPGDWCATTNDTATPECHDAWKSISYSTFQAFPIQVDKTCPAK